MIMSARRMSTMSVRLPAYPATIPMVVPNRMLISADEIPTMKAMRAPASSWLKMSLPMKSVPSQWRRLGPVL